MHATSYLRTRRSIQRFDRTRRVPLDVLLAALDDARYAPSPFNIQPWRFLVVTRDDLLVRLRDASNGQHKIVDAGAAVVFLADLEPEEHARRSSMRRSRTGRSPRIPPRAGKRRTRGCAAWERTT